jgi:LMBR1 domain-containing protein 1
MDETLDLFLEPGYSSAARNQGYIQVTLIWIVYAAVIALLFAVASIFVYIYQTPRERSVSVTTVCIFTLTCLLATVLLLPVDVALVSSTTSSRHGRRKDWASQDEVDKIVKTLQIVYYTLYSLDAVLCLLVVPFTYFWYEEYDEVAQEEGSQTVGSRFWGALKYTLIFVFLCVALFLVGFFVPIARHREGAHFDLDYFKQLLTENHGERALVFAMGLLITIGVIIYCFYTAAGMALLPLTLIKSAPAVSAPQLAQTTASELEGNRERQRQLEGRAQGNPDGLSSKDRRELEALVREERTLVRRERMAAENSGEGRSWIVRTWIKIEAVFRPLKLIGGFLLVIIALIIFASMLITGIDKARNSICGRHCGYVLANIKIFQPLNFILVKSAKVFPIDYVLFTLLVLFFFCASIVGIATVGIRFLWLTIFRIRKGHTSPQALLVATVMLTLITLALNYSIAMMVAPQYATFGPQTFCDHPPRHPGEQPDCTNHTRHIVPCSERTDNPAAKNVCTPSMVSQFLNRVTVNFPFFGAVDFWAQFVFLGVFLLVFLLMLFRTPKMAEDDDEDALEEEEEGLLASTGRRFGATWQDITGRVGRVNKSSGAAAAGERETRNGADD